ncbi:helix-turn-helix domain-containing protein [Streptococcus oralis]|uniref:helix-turn-helix domain-containing protein n=1 Tax=Streptococcus oralis TaxID=1303 RepID=UPI001CBCE5FF|nr:helix-turn-helix transcriptional regulator [Streptococcus oralis]MBZ2085656.1 helix-turn-helix domain-containing protein [Streptococcus oralis]MBZ2089469.1 helix-turn-helix domain-containing protein [Streptococcus oralis]
MNRLKELRQKKGDTQEDVAKVMGVTRRGYQKWENGESQIKPEKARQLADYFGVNVAYLLGLEDKQNILKIIQSNEFKKLLNDIDIEKINELGSAYKNVEEHINNPVKYNNFGKGLLNHIPSYMFTIEELINADKENNTNFADILINYISLNDYDKKIAFDLVQKLSERDDEKE